MIILETVDGQAIDVLAERVRVAKFLARELNMIAGIVDHDVKLFADGAGGAI